METKLVYYYHRWEPHNRPHSYIYKGLILLLPDNFIEFFQMVSRELISSIFRTQPTSIEYNYVFRAELIDSNKMLEQKLDGLMVRELIRESPIASRDSDSYKVAVEFSCHQYLTKLINMTIDVLQRKKNEVSLEGKCEDMKGIILPRYEDLVLLHKGEDSRIIAVYVKDEKQIESVIKTTLKKFHKVIKNK